MRRLVLLGLAALALAPAADATPGFRYGVAAGEITSTSAVLWTRSNELGRVRLLRLDRRRARGMPVVQITLRPSNARDRVVQRRVHGLKPRDALHLLFSTPYRKSAHRRPAAASGPRRRRADGADRCASRSAATPTAPATPRPAGPATTSSRCTAGWPRSGTTSTSTSATRSIPTARSAASPPALTVAGEVGQVQAEPRATPTCATFAAAPGSTATGTTTSSSTTSRSPSTARRSTAPASPRSWITHRSRTRP